MNDFLNNVKVAWISSMATLGTSFGSLIDVIPDNIGKLGVILTATLTVVLIRVQIMNLQNARTDSKLKKLQLKKLEREESEMD